MVYNWKGYDRGGGELGGMEEGAFSVRGLTVEQPGVGWMAICILKSPSKMVMQGNENMLQVINGRGETEWTEEGSDPEAREGGLMK